MVVFAFDLKFLVGIQVLEGHRKILNSPTPFLPYFLCVDLVCIGNGLMENSCSSGSFRYWVVVREPSSAANPLRSLITFSLMKWTRFQGGPPSISQLESPSIPLTIVSYTTSRLGVYKEGYKINCTINRLPSFSND